MAGNHNITIKQPPFLSTLNTLNFNTNVPGGLTWRIVQQKQCHGEDPEMSGPLTIYSQWSGQEMQEHSEKQIKTEKKQKAHKNGPVLPEESQLSGRVCDGMMIHCQHILFQIMNYFPRWNYDSFM